MIKYVRVWVTRTMTHFQARFCFLSFVCLAVGIGVNAVYLQDGREAKMARARGGIVTAALPGKNPSRRILRRVVPASSDLVRAIQRELTNRKYVTGSVDGVPGVMTSAAIMAYEHDEGIGVTGEASDVLLKRLLLGPSAGDKGNGSQSSSGDGAVHTIKAVQNILATLGYAPGDADGQLGHETEKAIKAFEKDRGLTQTGRISGRLVNEINRVTGHSLTVSS